MAGPVAMRTFVVEVDAILPPLPVTVSANVAVSSPFGPAAVNVGRATTVLESVAVVPAVCLHA